MSFTTTTTSSSSTTPTPFLGHLLQDISGGPNSPFSLFETETSFNTLEEDDDELTTPDAEDDDFDFPVKFPSAQHEVLHYQGHLFGRASLWEPWMRHHIDPRCRTPASFAAVKPSTILRSKPTPPTPTAPAIKSAMKKSAGSDTDSGHSRSSSESTSSSRSVSFARETSVQLFGGDYDNRATLGETHERLGRQRRLSLKRAVAFRLGFVPPKDKRFK